MRFAAYRQDEQQGLAVADADGRFCRRLATEEGYPGELAALIVGGTDLAVAGQQLLSAPLINLDGVELLPPLPGSGKTICIGLNYTDQSAESGYAISPYLTTVVRFASSMISVGTPIVRPILSEQLDSKSERAAGVGRGDRHIAKEVALGHVCIFDVATLVSTLNKVITLSPGAGEVGKLATADRKIQA